LYQFVFVSFARQSVEILKTDGTREYAEQNVCRNATIFQCSIRYSRNPKCDASCRGSNPLGTRDTSYYVYFIFGRCLETCVKSSDEIRRAYRSAAAQPKRIIIRGTADDSLNSLSLNITCIFWYIIRVRGRVKFMISGKRSHVYVIIVELAAIPRSPTGRR